MMHRLTPISIKEPPIEAKNMNKPFMFIFTIKLKGMVNPLSKKAIIRILWRFNLFSVNLMIIDPTI